MKHVKKTVFGIGLVVAVAMAWILFDRSYFRAWLSAAFQKSLHGGTVVRTGDRRASIDFSEDFESPPVVQATPRSRGTRGYRIEQVSKSGFVLELYDRAHTDIAFSWIATWDRWDEFSYFNKDAGLPERLEVPVGGEVLTAKYTGATDYIPTEFWIESAELNGTQLDEQDLLRAVLDASFREYKRGHTCSFFDKLRRTLRFRALKCPPRDIDIVLPKWDSFNPESWSIEREDGGLRLVRSTSKLETPDEKIVVDRIAGILQSAELWDLMQHNNQVLDVVGLAAELSDIEPPFTIIHFDTHSDLSAYRDPRVFRSPEQIGDFMNRLIASGFVREVYWVLPDWTRNEAYSEGFWSNAVPEFNGSLYARGHYEEGPLTLDIYVEPDAGLSYMQDPPDGIDPEDLIHVSFHKVTLDELPDFTGREDIFLELDADYFSNSGYRTRLFGSSNPSYEELTALLLRVQRALMERGVQPVVATLCLSPRFVSLEDRGYLTRIFSAAANQVGLKDYLIGYRHLDTVGVAPDARSVRRDDSVGDLISLLVQLDADGSSVDERIRIEAEDGEYQRALAIVRGKTGASEYDAQSVLLRMDVFDGRLDASIDLVQLERHSALDELDWIVKTPVFGDIAPPIEK